MFQQADPCDQYSIGAGPTELVRYFWEFVPPGNGDPPDITSGTGVSGGSSIEFPANTDSRLYYEWTPGNNSQVVIFQGYIKILSDVPSVKQFITFENGLGGDQGYRIKLSPTGIVSIEAHEGGGPFVSFDSTAVIEFGEYQYWEIKAKLADSSQGYCIIRIDGVEIINLDNLTSGNSWPGLVHFAFNFDEPGTVIRLDDLLILDGDNTDSKNFDDLKGEKRMTCLLPTSDVGGSFNSWDPGTPNNFEEVNDPIPGGADGDTTRCEVVTLTADNRFNHEPLPSGTTGIIGCMCLHETKSLSGPMDSVIYGSRLRNPTTGDNTSGPDTLSDIANAGTPTSYQFIANNIFHLDPSGVPFTEALVNLLQFGAFWQEPS